MMMFRTLWTACALMVFVPCSFGQILRVEVKNPTLLMALDYYIATARINDADPGMIKVRFTNLDWDIFELDSSSYNVPRLKTNLPSAVVEIRLEIGRAELEINPPGYYFIHKGRPVGIVTGFERFIRINKQQLRMFMKDIAYKLPKSNLATGDVPVAKVQIREESFEVLSFYVPETQ